MPTSLLSRLFNIVGYGFLTILPSFPYRWLIRIGKRTIGLAPYNPELKASPGKPWPSTMHYTRLWDLRQAPHQDAVPVVGLKEMSLRERSGNGIVVVAIPS
jgi:hypothetical protein